MGVLDEEYSTAPCYRCFLEEGASRIVAGTVEARRFRQRIEPQGEGEFGRHDDEVGKGYAAYHGAGMTGPSGVFPSTVCDTTPCAVIPVAMISSITFTHFIVMSPQTLLLPCGSNRCRNRRSFQLSPPLYVTLPPPRNSGNMEPSNIPHQRTPMTTKSAGTLSTPPLLVPHRQRSRSLGRHAGPPPPGRKKSHCKVRTVQARPTPPSARSSTSPSAGLWSASTSPTSSAHEPAHHRRRTHRCHAGQGDDQPCVRHALTFGGHPTSSSRRARRSSPIPRP